MAGDPFVGVHSGGVRTDRTMYDLGVRAAVRATAPAPATASSLVSCPAPSAAPCPPLYQTGRGRAGTRILGKFFRRKGGSRSRFALTRTGQGALCELNCQSWTV